MKILIMGLPGSGNPYFAQDEYCKIPLDKMLEYLPEDADMYYIDNETVDNDRVTNLALRIKSWKNTLDFIDQLEVGRR